MGPMNSASVHCSRLIWSNSAAGTKEKKKKKKKERKCKAKRKCEIQSNPKALNITFIQDSTNGR